MFIFIQLDKHRKSYRLGTNASFLPYRELTQYIHSILQNIMNVRTYTMYSVSITSNIYINILKNKQKKSKDKSIQCINMF